MTTDEHVRGRVWRDLVVSHSVILGKMEADLRTTTGLTLGQYDVLLRLHEAPGNTIRMGDLAELVLVTTSGVTRVVDRLVEAGLVERVRPDNDRRVVTVSMTPAGKKTLRKASAIHTRGIAEYFSDLIETEELPVLERFFSRLAANHTNQGGACDAHVEQLSITPTNR